MTTNVSIVTWQSKMTLGGICNFCNACTLCSIYVSLMEFLLWYWIRRKCLISLIDDTENPFFHFPFSIHYKHLNGVICVQYTFGQLHGRLSICWYYGWVWQVHDQSQIQITIWLWQKQACLRIYVNTWSLGALQARTSSWRPFGPLDFILCALRALRPVRRACLRSGTNQRLTQYPTVG